ncbi:glucosyltransferase domain-containing protein [Lachnoclostridium sp. Marseille-P6806]|uniref:glucosyltransferase domain-containing protein n=1 Tax=Lachnoclostridium sp. Marseille-P6806 TaxID=2364793 RepID=UPI001030F7E8|nr:glucosyltransferase domain-containing protein [Lachnoclostridium sp. Marseille-P6806]
MDLMKELRDRIPAYAGVCFFSAFAAGLLTHLYVLTNKLPNWDDISNIDKPGAMNDFGRWFLRFVQPWISSYSVPALKGVVTIALLSLTAVLVLRALELRSMTSAVLIGVTMTTFPAVTSGMLFMFTVASYSVAVLFAGAAVFCTLRRRFGWIPGAVLLCFCLGIYQAYLPFAVSVFLIAVQLRILRGAPLREVLRTAFREALALGGGLAGYLAMLSRYQLSDYRGISSVGKTAPADFLEAFLRAYHRILQYFVTEPMSYTSGFQHALHLLLLPLIALLLLRLTARRRLPERPATAAALALTVFLTPLGMSLVYLMAPEVTNASTLMIFSYMTVYFLAAGLAELCAGEAAAPAAPAPFSRTQRPARSRSRRSSGAGAGARLTRLSGLAFPCILPAAAALIVLLIACSNYRMANEAYFRTGLAFQRVSSYYERIISRLEGEGGWNYGERYAIAGDFWPEKNILSSYDLLEGRFADLEGLAIENGLFTSGVRRDFIRSYLGIDAPYASEEEYEAILASGEFAEMAAYPEEGCVRQIDGIWVVKIR